VKGIFGAVIAVSVLAGGAIGCFTTPKIDPCPGKLVCRQRRVLSDWFPLRLQRQVQHDGQRLRLELRDVQWG